MEELSEKENLIRQKHWIEERIEQVEKKDTEDKIKAALQKLQEVSDAATDIQHLLSLLWKRTKQAEEELAGILSPLEIKSERKI